MTVSPTGMNLDGERNTRGCEDVDANIDGINHSLECGMSQSNVIGGRHI